MCGRLACSLCSDDIPKACGIADKSGKQIEPKWLDDSQYVYKPFYNGPPSTTVPVVIYDTKRGNLENDYFLLAMKWGFIPSFAINPRALAHTHNARIENVLNSKLYKSSLFSNGRCVIVAEGFYEWQTTAGESNKQPYFIYQNPQENETKLEESKENEKYLMKMAGLWTSKQMENGTQYSCAILTTESDNGMSWLHHRMPIILNTSHEINDWLDHENVPYENILNEIKKPFSDRTENEFKLKHYTVDKKYVNKATCNDKKCMDRMTTKRANTLDSWLTVKRKK